jgi:hypothetical protein
MYDLLLSNGIFINRINDTLKYYNLKTRPYTSKGEFVSYKVDEESKDFIFIFKLGDTLLEYKGRIVDGNLDLY